MLPGVVVLDVIVVGVVTGGTVVGGVVVGVVVLVVVHGVERSTDALTLNDRSLGHETATVKVAAPVRLPGMIVVPETLWFGATLFDSKLTV